MPYPKKHSDEEVLEAYGRLNNVWLVAEEFGDMCGQSVWERLKKLNAIDKSSCKRERRFEDWEILKKEYPIAVTQKGGIEKLAKKLGRTKQFLCRKAGEAGLTDLSRPMQEHLKPYYSKLMKERHDRIGHPRGMLGKKHSKEVVEAMSERTIKMWADPNSKVNSEEHRQLLSDNMAKRQAKNGVVSNPYSRTKSGTISIAGREFFVRSSWEANVAAYLQFLKEQNEIKEWEYESETFWFEKIKRGVRSYKPDFKITNTDDSVHFIEVKGWMDAKSKTKLKRMRIYHPDVKMELIDQKRYKEICKSKKLFKEWGQLDKPKVKTK